MTIQEIITVPDPTLNTRAEKVKNFSAKLQYLIGDMIETMRSANGVGLAAPQIGISQQIIVVEYTEEKEFGHDAINPKKLYVVINPSIFQFSSKSVVGVEACLSVPGFAGEIVRYQSVKIKGLNRHGRPLRLKVDGWLARIFQHEIDHIHGVLYTDRASRVWSIPAMGERSSLHSPEL
jgi:peptide deformylase